MGFIETTYGSNPNLSQVNIDSNLNLGTYGITTDGELDINNSDLIGVKQFVCNDYLGAVQAIASNNTRWILTLDDVTTGNGISKKFRVPSNFVSSNINFTFYATNSTANSRNITLIKYNLDGTYSTVLTFAIPANTTTETEYNNPSPLSVIAGEVYAFRAVADYYGHHANFIGSMGVKIQCDLTPVTSGYWSISD